MQYRNFCVFFMLAFLIPITLTECPRACECKWKSGKESVVCINANLTVVPEKLDSGTQILDLTGNNFASLRNEEFSKAGLVNLQKLYISRCRLKSIDKYAFNNLINLVDLDLSFNLLSSVPSDTLESISEIRDLKLSGNPIYKISNDAFVNTRQLIRLEMSNCKISNIESRGFHGLAKSLEWLKLDGNKLSDVGASSFTIFQNLHGLELASNPWNCSCSLRPLRKWMQEHNVPYNIPPVCSYPKRLAGKTWDKLDLDDFACIPEIFAYESKRKGVEGKNVTLSCQIDGIPKPSVKWLVKNKLITNLTSSSFGTNYKKFYVMHLTNTSSELTIFSADMQDSGTYVCTAENRAGKAEASVTLAISKHSNDNIVPKKVIVVCVLIGIVLTLVSCIFIVNFFKKQKKQLFKWKPGNMCNREDNYEKIELNQKIAENKLNGELKNREDNCLTTSSKKNGDYRVVPAGESEHEDEDESTLEVATPSTSTSRRVTNEDDILKNDMPKDLDPNSIRTEEGLKFRDNIRRTYSSTFGTYKASPSSTVNPSATFYSVFPFSDAHPETTLSTNQPTVTSDFNYKGISSTYQPDRNAYLTHIIDSSKKNPDIINLHGCGSSHAIINNNKSHSANGSYSNINELFCTLPRKKNLGRYTSNDSQTLLLAESQYNSSGGESSSSLTNSNRRVLIDFQKQTIVNSNHRVNQLSGSFLNLAKEDSATPLLDINNLENKVLYKGHTIRSNYTNTIKLPNHYDYHAAQLERFLEEYKVLQKQITEMKETCDNIVQSKIAAKDKNAINETIINCDTLNSSKTLKESVNHNNKYDSKLVKYLISQSPSTRNISSDIINNT